MRTSIKSALSVFIVAVMLVCSFSGIPVMAADGISIDCVDGEIVVSGSFTGDAAVGETYNVVLETYDEEGNILKTDKSEDATVVSGTNNFSFTADIVANVQPTKAYIKTSGNKNVVAPAEKTLYSLKVLAIGNSFSVDGTQWIYGIAEDLGIDNIVVGNLYIGGCSLQTHANNAKNNSASYTYYKNSTGEWTERASTTMLYGIQDEDWNLITVQQVSQNSGLSSTFEPYLTNLINYVNENKTNPYAKVAWHMTWAYQQTSTHSGFPNYNNDQMTMYNAIISAGQTVEARSDIDFVIPSGTAIQNARTSFLGDNLTRDGYHLDYHIGRYIAGLTWVHKITGLPIDNIDYVPSGASFYAPHFKVAVDSVKNAVENPYEVTSFAANMKPEPEGTVLFSDDFESYTAVSGEDNYVTEKSAVVAGPWKTAGVTWGFSSTNVPHVGIIESGTDNNVLAIEAKAEYSKPRFYVPVEPSTLMINTNYATKYKFDIYRANKSGGGGIRFNRNGNWTSFYELYFQGSNGYSDGTMKTTLSKLEDGTYTRLSDEDVTVSGIFTNNMISQSVWYTVDLTVDGGSISWTVKDKNTGTVLQTGSYYDANPLVFEYSSVTLFAAGQSGTYTYFDNFFAQRPIPEPENKVVGSDDFESYTAVSGEDNYVTEKSAVVAGPWKTAGVTWGFSSTNVPHVGIIESGTDNNVLAIEAKAAYSSPRFYVPVEPSTLMIDTSYLTKYTFDIYRANSAGGGGIRFNRTGNWTSFYELYFQGANGYSDGTLKTSLSKLTSDGTYTRLPASEVSISGTLGNNMIGQSKWYTVELIVNGGYIRWTVKDKITDKIVQTGSYTDPNPLVSEEATVTLFGAGQSGNYTYFDNFSVVSGAIIYPRCDVYDDEFSVEFSPKSIENIKAMKKLQVIAAYYEAENGVLTDIEIREITDLSKYVLETFTLNPDYHYIKIFIWNGDVADAVPAYETLKIEREREFIVTDITQIGDPQILLYGDTYYMYSTSSGKGFKVSTSKDLINWELYGYCYHMDWGEAYGVWSTGDHWAPEVTYHNGKFIMHYSAAGPYSYKYRVGVAISDSPLGPFKDVYGAPMFEYGYAAIDASVLITDKGNYLYYSKDGYGNKVNGINTSQTYCVEIDDTLTEIIGEPKLMITPEYDFELLSAGAGQYWNEGPTVIEYKTKSGDTKYIMNYSANHYRTNNYAICIAVADDPMGPWVKPAWNPVLTNRGDLFGAGHNAFFTGKDGKLYTSFHVQTDPANPSGDRRLVIGLVEFREDEDGNIRQDIVGCIYKD